MVEEFLPEAVIEVLLRGIVWVSWGTGPEGVVESKGFFVEDFARLRFVAFGGGVEVRSLCVRVYLN